MPKPAWIIAYREKGQWWEQFETATDLQAAYRILDELSQDQEWAAIFRNRENWSDYRPRYVRDRRDHTDTPIRGLGGLINSLDSSWF